MTPVYFNGVDVTKAYLNGRPVFLSFPGLGFDPDALAYITAVEAADGQALEAGVKTAINAFVVGCKSDGIWNAIKASCILAGARTLSGSLQPLVGSAPTNFNFVAGDYNRTTGLVGNGGTKYLNSNRNNNADPQNNVHKAVYIGQAGHGNGTIISSRVGTAGYENIEYFAGAYAFRSRTTGAGISVITPSSVGFFGQSRASGSTMSARALSQDYSAAAASSTPTAVPVIVYSRDAGSGPPNFTTNARLAFYSIGESINLALLDARVTTLINNIAFVINTGLNPLNYDANTIAYVNAGYAAGGTLA
jgi:hypothetical protein